MFGVLGFGVRGLESRALSWGAVIVHSCFFGNGGMENKTDAAISCRIKGLGHSWDLDYHSRFPPYLSLELRGTMQIFRIREICIIWRVWVCW